MALMLKDTLSTVKEGAKVMVVESVQTTAVVPNAATKVVSTPRENEDSLLLEVVSAPLPVAICIEMLSSSDDDSSDSEDSDSGSEKGSGSGNSSYASSSSHLGKPMKPSFPVGVGTAVVSAAELIDAVSAASVATAKLLGSKLPSASLFEGHPEEACRRLMVLAKLMMR
jgi:hypothetical protein